MKPRRRRPGLADGRRGVSRRLQEGRDTGGLPWCVQPRDRRLHIPDLSLQVGGLRDSYGRQPRRRLPDLLEAGGSSKATIQRSPIEIVAISTYEDMKALGPHRRGAHSRVLIGTRIGRSPTRSRADQRRSWQTTMKHRRTRCGATLITGYARFGWAVDVLKRTQNIDDKNSIVHGHQGLEA